MNLDPWLPTNTVADDADSLRPRSQETTATTEVRVSGHNDQPAERVSL
jgi:hypothetical protein